MNHFTILPISICLLISLEGSRAATFTVGNTNSTGPGSLLQAVLDSQSNPGPDVISLANLTGRIVMPSSFTGLRDVSVVGPGARSLTIATPLISIGGEVSISSLKLEYNGGGSAGPGGAGGIIYNQGTLFLNACELTAARIRLARGAAIYSAGTLRMSGTTIYGNSTQSSGSLSPPFIGCTSGVGGGLYVAAGTVTITNSTFSGNSAEGFFGTAAGSSVSCPGQGGAIYVESGTVLLVNCTLAGNSADYGGGIYNVGGAVTMMNTLITDTLFGTETAGGKNLITNLPSAKILPLTNNGGPTLTRALMADSPAIDQGASNVAPMTDQRGVVRPQGRRIDVGAYELEGVPNLFQLVLAGDQHGTVSRTPDLLVFPSNTLVTVIAMADEDYEFMEWTGGVTGSENPLLVTMTRDMSITASFRYAPHTTVTSPGFTHFVVNTNAWGKGSFRQATRNVMANGGGTIAFSNVTGTILLSLGVPQFSANIRIVGPGASNVSLKFPVGVQGIVIDEGVTGRIAGLTIEGARDARLFGGAISNAGVLLLQQAHISGWGSSNGGAIFNGGSLKASACVFAQNSATSGGAIWNSGQLSVSDSAFNGNYVYAAADSPSMPNYSLSTGGGALYLAAGAAMMERCVFEGNAAAGRVGIGGAVYVLGGRATITDTLISGNFTRGAHGSSDFVQQVGTSGGSTFGSGFYVRGGQVRLTNCLFVGNSGLGGDSPQVSRFPGSGGESRGGGMHVREGNVFAVNCTFSGNAVQGGNSGGGGFFQWPGGGVPGYGGGIVNEAGFLQLENCTLTLNHANGGNYGGLYGTNFGVGLGGGIYGTAVIRNTVLSGNHGSTEGTNGIVADDFRGQGSSLGHNLIGVASSFSNLLTSDRIGVDPLLGPLNDNGGFTRTHALLASSPAIDAGAQSVSLTDQRGQPRHVDDPAVANALDGDGTDMGAVEVNHRLEMTGAVRLSTNVHVRFTTVSDRTYGVEYKDEVADSNWGVLWQGIPGTGGIVTTTNYGAGLLPHRFYRAFEQRP